MATFYRSSMVLGKNPPPISEHSDIVSQRVVFPITAAFAANDILELCVLPADHVFTDAYVDCDDLDSGAAVVFDGGIMSGNVGYSDLNRTVGAELFTGATVGQAGGVLAFNAASIFRVAAAPFDRSVGLKITTAGTTVLTATPASKAVTLRGLWQPNTAYAQYDYLYLPDGRRAYVSTAGTSGTVRPYTLDTTLRAGTVTDGTVTWTILDPYIALTINYRGARNGI